MTTSDSKTRHTAKTNLVCNRVTIDSYRKFELTKDLSKVIQVVSRKA